MIGRRVDSYLEEVVSNLEIYEQGRDYWSPHVPIPFRDIGGEFAWISEIPVIHHEMMTPRVSIGSKTEWKFNMSIQEENPR